MKYEIAVCLGDGKIVWCAGGEGGSVHDITLLRMYGLLDMLRPSELILGDKAYIGESQILTPFKSPKNDIEIEINSWVNKSRIVVENVFGRIKKFSCLTTKWRHDTALHPMIFHLIARLTALDIASRPIVT